MKELGGKQVILRPDTFFFVKWGYETGNSYDPFIKLLTKKTEEISDYFFNERSEQSDQSSDRRILLYTATATEL